MAQTLENLPKLIRCVRQPNGYVKLFVGQEELMFTDYQERLSGMHGHVVTLSLLGSQFAFEGFDDANPV